MLYGTMLGLLISVLVIWVVYYLMSNQKYFTLNPTIKEQFNTLLDKQDYNRDKYNGLDDTPTSLYKFPIDKILKDYNITLRPIILDNVQNEYTYYHGNFPLQLKDEARMIINSILLTFNSKYGLRYQFVDFDTINEKISSTGNKLITVEFYTNEFYTFSSRKLIIEYYVSNKDSVSFNGDININYLKTEYSGFTEPTLLNKVFVHGVDTLNVVKPANTLDKLIPKDKIISIDGEATETQLYEKINQCQKNNTIVEFAIDRNKLIIPEIQELTKCGYPQEPCVMELDEWDKHGVYKQKKVAKGCKGINYGSEPLKPRAYENPTVATLPAPNIFISQTQRLPKSQHIYGYLKNQN